MPSNKFLIISIFAAAFAISMLFYAVYATNSSERIEASQELVVGKIGKEKVVTIDESGFVPSTITVRSMEQVKWRNTGAKEHRIAFKLGSFYDSLTKVDEILKSGDSVNFTFERPGTYHYFDKLNTKFTGEVIVE